MQKGKRVFHLDKSLGLGEVLEVSSDDARVCFRDPVSGATKTGIYPIAKLRIAEQAAAAPKPDGPLMLRSRCSQWDETGRVKKCSQCHRRRGGLWKFTRSSWGEVHLCMSCKAEAMDRTYGRKDAFVGARSGGQWGKNG